MKFLTDNKHNPWGVALVLLLLLLILINTVLVGITFDLISKRYPAEDTQLGHEQALAKDILEYNREFASNLGVLERTAVREALAGFNYEIETASSSDDLTSLVINQGRRIQEIILREWEVELQDEAVSIINEDKNVLATDEIKRLSLEINEDVEDNENAVIIKPDDFLESATVERIQEIFLEGNPGRDLVIEVEIIEGEARLKVPYNPVEHIQSLNEEIDDLRLTNRDLRVKAGFDEMRGDGVRVTLSDGEGAISSDAIVHDTDVRDVVNELFDSGAQGVSVGGKRLTATSSIRCAGTLIEVDGKKIPMPVDIKAVGEPELLKSGLDIIRNSWEVQRGIGFEVEKAEDLTLPAH